MARPILAGVADVPRRPADAVRWLLGRRFGRYLIATVGSVVAGQTLLAVSFDLLGWPAIAANAFATAVVTGPAFIVNRRWVWQQEGPSRLYREAVPFWVLAFVGLAVSSGAAALAGHAAARLSADRGMQTLVIVGAVCASYFLVWLTRFIVLDRAVFVAGHRRRPGDRHAGPS